MSDPAISVERRREARERALALLYEAEVKGVEPAEIVTALPVPPDPFAADLVRGVGDTVADLDERIGAVSRGWTVARMPALDRALLRVGCYELLHEPETPTAVIINEAVELASRFSTDDSGRFVNGVLSRLAHELRPPRD
ncbi:MAG TPA: transcription antitermination factor NusB [Acidimicrobiales bacterium]|nr:transcription antitermination factor NusB [Acidimicrobiales bacterium]